MQLLFIGLALWSLGHLVPALAPVVRKKLMRKLGEGAYKGGFAILMILSVVFIAFGWRAADVSQIYTLPGWARHIAMLIVLLGFICLGGSNMKSNLKRKIRHPQLVGFSLWAIGHLLANGDSRSLMLFGTMLIWALVEIWAINRRDLPQELPAVLPIKSDVILVVSGLVVGGIVMLLHPFFTGVSLIGA